MKAELRKGKSGVKTVVDAQKFTATHRWRPEDTWKTTEKGEIFSRRLCLVQFKVNLYLNVEIVWEKGMTVFFCGFPKLTFA